MRLLQITTTEPQRIGLLEHVAAAEHIGENACPFLFIEAPMTKEDDGWFIRRCEVRAQMEMLRARELAHPEGAPVAEMPEDDDADTDLGRFCLTLAQAVKCCGAPIGGLVVVLTPMAMEDPLRWREEVAALVARPELSRVRWVIVDLQEPTCMDIARGLEKKARIVYARLDMKAVEADVDALLAGTETAPPGAGGLRLSGAAGPDEAPPKRYNAQTTTPEQIEKLAAEAGVPPAVLQVEPMQKLRGMITGAARAMRKGDVFEAISKQREARAFCRTIGWRKGAVMMALLLGGYALQADAPKTASAIFMEARAEATDEGMAEQAAQAQMALAAGLLLERKEDEAARAFAEAGRLAESLGSSVMAIEGYRMCGQLCMARGDDKHAAQAFVRALECAGEAKPEEKALSSAPEAARALATICRSHELVPQADALEAQALAMEQRPQVDETMEQRPQVDETMEQRPQVDERMAQQPQVEESGHVG
jgi:hypothetical protein